MEFASKPLHFFLGANTPQGFVSRFDQLADPKDGWREFVIKGGPGAGKSTLMKKAYLEAAAHCKHAELIHCSSDVDSLDGVILHDIKTAIADGTSPHVIEPKYPGAFEQLIDLSNCWDAHQLFEDRESIMCLSAKISKCHEHACRFMGAAQSLLSDTYRIALDATETQKVAKAASRISQAEFKGGKNRRGKESVRFLSAVCNNGIRLFDETAKALCDRIYLIEDSYGASSRLLLSVLRSDALEAGFDIYTCYSPLAPFEKIEHLFIPQLKLGFMITDDFLKPDIAPWKIIRSRRFTDRESLKKTKKRIAFNKKASVQMLEQAGGLIREAKGIHDQLESYYIRAMDFQKVDQVCAQTLEWYRHILQAYRL